MWFAVLDGIVIGAVVALALLRPFQRVRVGPPVTVLTVGVVGGLVGAGLGFTLVAGSSTSGPLQVTPIVASLVGAVAALVVLRTWVTNDRAAVVAAAAAEQKRARVAVREQRRAARREPREPSALGELVVLGLAALRRCR